MPFFSVIIPSFNRYDCLKKAIDSVLHQTFRDYELIIVDDGSTDKTPVITDEYGKKIIYIRQDNSGVSRARNTGIARADSRYIAFLDSDDIWLPDKLYLQHSFIIENPDIHIHQTEETWIRNGRRVNPMKKHKKKEGRIFIESLELCMISPSSVVMDRHLFEKYGLFDEKLPVCEDYDLWLRITCSENTGLIKKELLKKYGGHESQLSKSCWGMDRFRIYSILKLLQEKGDSLGQLYRVKAVETAEKKSRILRKGAEKRNKRDFADYLEEIIISLENDSYSSINPENLLRE